MALLSALILGGLLNAMPPTPPPFLFSHADIETPSAVLHVEVADTGVRRERGLMFRTQLPHYTGMLFVFASDTLQAFWMKNTLVNLDMVFIAASGRVRSIAVNVPRSDASTPDDRVARRYGRAKYVLELPAFEARRDGLRPGAAVRGLDGLRALN